MMMKLNNIKQIGILVLLFFSSLTLFGQGNEPVKNVKILVDTKIGYQVIDHFGASDAWSIQNLAQWTTESKNEIADLLFSQEMNSNGSPKGIGLSIWRINLGAGSKEQGKESGIKDSWRRASTFINKQGEFQAQNFSGQLWFAQAARERNVERLLLFLNSPPVWLTSNQLAYPTQKGKTNLPVENYDKFSDYIVKSIQGLKLSGVEIDYVSPFNEPQWDWNAGNQEGSPYRNSEMATIAKQLNEKFVNEEIETKIELGESGRIEYLYSGFDKPHSSQMIDDFYGLKSENYIGDLENISSSISGHSYFTTSPNEKAIDKRKQLRAAVEEKHGLKYWMSEYCILGGNDGEINGKGVDLGMNSALYMSRVIHNDLVFANASAWHWWLAVSPYDYKDGLIYIPKNKVDSEYKASKMLWTLGNYSFFVRPGYQRVDLKIPGLEYGEAPILGSAYISLEEGKLIMVLTNPTDSDYNLDIQIDETKLNRKLKAYLTNEERNLQYVVVNGGDLKIPKKAVYTIVSELGQYQGGH